MWLSRDKINTMGSYWLWGREPGKTKGGNFAGGAPIMTFCPKEFHRFTTGVRLKPGQCREIKEIRFIPKKVKK